MAAEREPQVDLKPPSFNTPTWLGGGATVSGATSWNRVVILGLTAVGIVLVLSPRAISKPRSSPTPHYTPYPLWIQFTEDGDHLIADIERERFDTLEGELPTYIASLEFDRHHFGWPFDVLTTDRWRLTLEPLVGASPREMPVLLRRDALEEFEVGRRRYFAIYLGDQGTFNLIQHGEYTRRDFNLLNIALTVFLYVSTIIGTLLCISFAHYRLKLSTYLRRSKRLARGLCPVCRYDLTGSELPATSCPECGSRWEPPRTTSGSEA